MDQKNLLIILITIILTAAVFGGGVYFWQSSALKAERLVLQQQIDQLERQIEVLREEKDKTTKCSINPSTVLFAPVEYGDYQAYAKKEGDQSYIILCNEEQEIIVDQGEADWDENYSNLGEVKKYDILKFSPQGKFLIVGVRVWEGHIYLVYDIGKEKIVYKSYSFIYDLEFTPDDQYAYYCGAEDRSAADSGVVFKTENFEIETSGGYAGADFNIYSQYDSGTFLGVSCKHNQEFNVIVFDVLEYEDFDKGTGTRKRHYYSLDKGMVVEEL